MSADFMVAWTTAPHDIKNKSINIDDNNLTEIIENQLTDKVMNYLIAHLQDMDSFQYVKMSGIWNGTPLQEKMKTDPDLDPEKNFTREDAIVMLSKAYEESDSGDTSEIIFPNGVPGYITGGDSYGDLPTNSFEYVTLLSASGIFDAPIFTEEELDVPDNVVTMMNQFSEIMPDKPRRDALSNLAMIIRHSCKGDISLDPEHARKLYGQLFLDED